MSNFLKSTKAKIAVGFSGLVLVATVALAAGYDQTATDWLKIGKGTTADKKLEFNAGLGVNDAILQGDSSGGLAISAASVRLLERPANGTNYIMLSVPSSQATDTTLTLPKATDTLVGKATTDVFTNKSISGLTNTVTHVDMSNLDGILPPASGGTGVANPSAGTLTLSAFTLALTTTANTNVTLPTSGTLVNRTSAEALSNKDLSASTNTYRDASGSVIGAVNTTTQTFAGSKTFSNATSFSDNITVGHLLNLTPFSDSVSGTVNAQNINSGGMVIYTGGPVTLNGINSGGSVGNGTLFVVVNNTGAGLTVNSASGSATANDRITLSSTPKTVATGNSMWCVYMNGWRCIVSG